MSEGKEVRRYYDFSHLLAPAKALPYLEHAIFIDTLGEKQAVNLTAECLAQAAAIYTDIMYEKKLTDKFLGTEEEMDRSLAFLRKLSMKDIWMYSTDNFALRPALGPIYSKLYWQEIQMMRKKSKTEPLRRFF